MDATSPVSSPVGRLSSAQKRDLFGQALAAVITTALIAAPLLTPPSGSVDVSSETALPAQSFAHVAVTAAEKPLDPRGRPQVARGVSRAPIRSGDRVVARADGRKPLSRKITGWLTGDGTHTVRPFPTVVQ